MWTGSEMIVWGGEGSAGRLASGGRYAPVADVWSATSTLGDPSARSRHTAIWTGSEMIVWGGCSSGECQVELAAGGRYDPSSDSWVPTGSPAAPSPRINHTAVWTGSEMIVWGGCDDALCLAFSESGFLRSGGRYDPAADAWSPTSTLQAPFGRNLHTAVWSGEQMLVWGGWRGSTGLFTDTGGGYCAVVPGGGDPDIEVDPEPLVFLDVPVDTTETLALTVSNSGAGDLAVLAVRLGDPTAPFAISDDGCSGTAVPPGGDCEVLVDFSPTEVGTFLVPLGIRSDDPDEPRTRVRVGGRAVE